MLVTAFAVGCSSDTTTSTKAAPSAPVVATSPTAAPPVTVPAPTSPTPAPTKPPKQSSTSAAPKPPTGPKVVSFSTSGEDSCAPAGGSAPLQPMITLTWSAVNADSVYVAVDDPNGPFETGLPLSGSYQLPFQCEGAHSYHVVAVRGSDKGVKSAKYVDGVRA